MVENKKATKDKQIAQLESTAELVPDSSTQLSWHQSRHIRWEKTPIHRQQYQSNYNLFPLTTKQSLQLPDSDTEFANQYKHIAQCK